MSDSGQENLAELSIREAAETSFPSVNAEIAAILYETQPKDNKAVIICHGAYDSQSDWQNFANYLCNQGFTTLTFDFIGHGKSGGMPSLVDLRLWAYNIRDAMNFLRTKGYHQYALVGWNLGGSAALLAATHDARISCLVTLATPVFLMPPFGERVAYGLASIAARVKKFIWKKPLILSRLNELDSMCFLTDDEANGQYIFNPARRARYQTVPIPESLDSVWFDITHTISKIRVPVLVIHGQEDEIIPAKQSYKLYSLLQDPKELHVLPQSGHALHLDSRKDDVFRLASKWIKHYLRAKQTERGRSK